MLRKHLWNGFYCIWWLKFCNLYYEISSFPEVLYIKDVPKNFWKFTDKNKKQSSGCVLSKDILKTFSKFTGKHLYQSFFLSCVEVLRDCNFIIEDFNTCVFMWNLWTFQEQLFWRTSVNVCFQTSFEKRLQYKCFTVNYSRTPIL